MAAGIFFQEIELPEQKLQDDGVLFPAVLTPNHSTDSTGVKLCDLEEAIKANKLWLESLLQKRGVIFFRGFHVSSPSEFNSVIEAFGFPEMPYEEVGGRAPRTKVVGRVYTANNYPDEKGIPFHHEMAYIPNFPTKLFFYCDEEPQKGGETPVVLSHIIYEKMKEKYPKFVEQLEEHGLAYIKLASETDDPSTLTGTGWKSIYKTDDKKVAEKAIRLDKESGKKTWFNSLALNYSGPASRNNNIGNSSVELGNGEPVPDDAAEYFFKILEEECVAIPWKKDVVESSGYEDFRYDVGGAGSRTEVVGRVYTANEAPPDQEIPFHHEMSHATVYPSKLFFFCEVEPGSGGETCIALSHVIYEKMKQKHPKFVQEMEEKGLIYTRVIGDESDPSSPIGRSWKLTFMTDDKTVAEERATKMGMKLEWIEGGARVIVGPKSGSRYHEARKRKVWFNRVEGGMKDKLNQDLSKAVMLSDGKPVPADVSSDSSKICNEECVALQWRKGDVLLLDNLAVMHSRRLLTALPRRVLASFCK
ncbi:hypothetical protein OSB04_004403 [Centaurea solstitialis]|uniref:TauD/TfdA-like domain-containing protein n=1 Tax=Centaurea solstitialis TaxID=347529 RepID=A0AA38UDE9_9ASTR|nr:hypothetical protein OSB04_004403 [Centaurea solstitialis]